MAKPKSNLWWDILLVEQERGKVWKDNDISHPEYSKVLETVFMRHSFHAIRWAFSLKAHKMIPSCSLLNGRMSEEHWLKTSIHTPIDFFFWGGEGVVKGRKLTDWHLPSYLTQMSIFFLQKEGRFILGHCKEIKYKNVLISLVNYNVWIISSFWCFRFPAWGH